MADLRMQADSLTQACVTVTEEDPVPHLVIICDDLRTVVTLGGHVRGVGDIGPITAAGATVIARAAADWERRLTEFATANEARTAGLPR